MTDAVAPSQAPTVLLSEDGVPLKRKLRRALRLQKLRAFLLVLPLLAFVVATFLVPIGMMLFRSVENQLVPNTLPRAVEALKDWEPTSGELPDEAVYAAMVEDIREAAANKTHTRVGSRLNYEKSGMSSLFRKSARRVKRMDEGPYKEQLIKADKDWGDVETWAVIKRFSGHYTSGYYLQSLDLTRNLEGDIVQEDENQRIYLFLFARTLAISIAITVLTLIIGYPVAYLLASLPARQANLLLILVLLPFWTSLLVRTSSWVVLLQQQGVLNDTLVWLGVVADNDRLEMMFNQTGTLVAMTHILLPFMILPLYSVMQTIPPTYVRAAKSLGATNFTAFWRVYFPNSIPGIGAGAILVFILSIGYYITPELVGGTSGTFISNRIAFHMNSSLNWGLAAALATLLLAATLILYYVYDRIVGVDNVKLG